MKRNTIKAFYEYDKQYQAMVRIRQYGKHDNYTIKEIDEIIAHLNKPFGLLNVRQAIEELDKKKSNKSI